MHLLIKIQDESHLLLTIMDQYMPGTTVKCLGSTGDGSKKTDPIHLVQFDKINVVPRPIELTSRLRLYPCKNMAEKFNNQNNMSVLYQECTHVSLKQVMILVKHAP